MEKPVNDLSISRRNDFFKKSKSLGVSILSILAGILIGFIIMLIVGIATNGVTGIGNSFYGLLIIFKGPFNGLNVSKEFGNMMFYAVPLIFTGLSIGLAYKTGLFNIGAPGQFFMGSLGAILIALGLQLQWGVQINSGFGHFLIWFLAILFGTLLGALWGAIPGLLKAFFGINEVIVCIMTNWIAASIVSWVFSDMPNLISKEHGGYLKFSSVTGNTTPTLGLDKITGGSMLDMSIIIAVLICVGLFIVLNKTTFGYELKACGLNHKAAKYAGINEKKCTIISMAIAGGLAALGGALYYLNPGIEFQFSTAYQVLPDYGFNGIPTALLASCNPIGIIFSALFIRYLAIAGNYFPLAGFNKYFADLIVAIIIYLAGFSKFFSDLFDKAKFKKEKPDKKQSPKAIKRGKPSVKKEVK